MTISKLNAELIADQFGLSLADIAKAIGVTCLTLEERTDAPIAQPGLQELVNAWEMLNELFGDEDSIRAWVRRPLRRFRGELHCGFYVSTALPRSKLSLRKAPPPSPPTEN